MTVPTEGDEFAKLVFHLRMAQEAAAMIAHLRNANDDRSGAKAFLTFSENMKKTVHHVTLLAMRKLQ